MSKAPASKYGDVEVQRTHIRYTPALAPLAFSCSVIRLLDVQTLDEDVLGTMVGLVELGVEQEGATMKADPSEETLGNDAPLIFTDCDANAGTAGGTIVVMVAAQTKSEKGKHEMHELL